MVIIASIHIIKIKPNSEQETRFTKILENVGVDQKNIPCRFGYIFWTPFDEYIISDGLYKQIYKDLEKINSRIKHTPL